MALGRGLGDILSEVEEAYQKDLSDINSFELESKGAHLEEVLVSEINPNPFQPRKHFDEKSLEELATSIKVHGLLQPIVVVKKENKYILIAGERRLRAHKLSNLNTIKAIIADISMDEIKLRELALIENIQRENLNAIELANSYKELIDIHAITHDDLSDIVHKSRSQITNTMRLLSLSPYVQKQLVLEKITQGHAKTLIGLSHEKQKIILDSIMGQKLSVRDTEKIIKNHKSNSKVLNNNKDILLIEKYKKEFDEALPFTYKLKMKSIEISLTNEKDIVDFLNFIKKPKKV